MNRIKLYILCLFVFSFLIPWKSSSASVELLYFLPITDADSITLIWETATEINNAGFYIQRSEDADDNFTRISQFIPSQGDPFTGHYYEYLDGSAQPGILYYYILEIVGADGISEYSEIISAIMGGFTPTPTITPTLTPPGGLTPTITITPNPSLTPTASGVVYTPTTRPGVTRPAIIATSPSFLPTSLTETRAPTVTQTPTQTLQPLRGDGLAFPEVTATETMLASNVSEPLADANDLSPSSLPTEVPSNSGLLILIIILLWVVLAIFLALYIRRLRIHQ
jgi:hypothetical protein